LTESLISLHAKHIGTGHVHFLHHAVAIQREASNRLQIVAIQMPAQLRLKLNAGLAQFLGLHVELNLMYL